MGRIIKKFLPFFLFITIFDAHGEDTYCPILLFLASMK